MGRRVLINAGWYNTEILRGTNFIDTVWAGGGNDTITGLGEDDVLHGHSGNDVINGGFGDDNVLGEGDNDILFGGRHNDRVDGGTGNDTLSGGLHTDTLIGGAGRDWLSGDRGNDMLTGGTIQDIFQFRFQDGTDRITDFGDGPDRLDLRAFDFDSAAEVLATATQSGTSVHFAFGHLTALLLLNTTIAELEATDFIL